VSDFHTYFVGTEDWGFAVWAHNQYLSGPEGAVELKQFADGRFAWVDKNGNIVRSTAGAAPQTSGEWVRPKGWQLPRNGTWEGTPGNSNFKPHNPESLGLKPGEVVPFRNGSPDFSKWVRETFTAREPLTGNPTSDQKAMIRAVAEQNGWTHKETIKWLETEQLSLHHAGGNEIQLVPSALHGNRSAEPSLPGVHHQGGAYNLRNQ
jgi:hypothetical protein